MQPFFRSCIFATLAVGVAFMPGLLRAEDAAPGNNGSAFRYSYPVRDTGNHVYTEENPPATRHANAPAPQSADNNQQAPTPDRQASFEAPLAVNEQTFSTDESLNLPPTTPDIGEGRFSKSPFRFSFAVYEGYNSNVNGTSTNPVESMYTSIAAGVGYQFGTSRLKLDLSLNAALAFYYNNENLQNDGLFPTVTLGFSADYKATPKLDLSFTTSTGLLSQPNFSSGGGGPSNYVGDYISSASTFAATYRWLPKFQTVTSYSPLLYYYIDPEGPDYSYFDQTVGQQFLFLWKPTTQLVTEYRFNIRNYWELTDYDSLGNYLLLGFNHTFNPRTTATLRAGAEQRISQNPVAGGTYNYIGPFGEATFAYSFSDRTSASLLARYGTTGTGVSNYAQNQQFLIGLNASHRFGRRATLGAFFNFQNNAYSQPGGNINGVDLTPSFSYNVFNAGINAGYYLIPDRWSLQAGYAYTTLISGNTQMQGEYSQNIIFLGTKLDF